MRTVKLIVILLAVMTVCFSGNALAKDIEKGTVSVGAASNLGIFNYTSDTSGNSDNYTKYKFSGEIGYFVLNNFEIGTKLTYKAKHNGGDKKTSKSIAPYLGYHFSVNKNSNIYTLIGFGVGKYEDDYGDRDCSYSSSLLFGEVGYEYFLTDNVTVGPALYGEHKTLDYDEEQWDNKDLDEISGQIKLKIYF
ncbi:MAG: porin family protein [Desulfobacteraceae bacterium]|nr:porin family protein [Desulfobacteraceae bacterium]